MKVVRRSEIVGHLSAPFVLVIAVLLTAIAYYPGLGGSIHFDDASNLGALARIDGPSSAFRFISEGFAGPLGRPLALASFVPQAYAWPDAPDALIYTNICLHLLNGVLVVWVLFLLGSACGRERAQAARIAAMSGAVWMLLPILASSSLLIVQRMTTLSATFSLTGLVGYFYSRSLLGRRPALSVALMAASTFLGTVLAALAKENGALLPLFVLVTECTVLARSSTGAGERWRRAWCWLLTLPAAALVVYLALRVPYGESTVLMRGFTGSDRLLTEARVLWEYLYHAFVPMTSSLGPFHDDHAVYRNWFDPLSIMAVASWLAVLVAAVAWRRRAPLFTFAVVWYLVGHALESTTISLELYFEHRNYLPLVGPVFALVASAAAIPRRQALVQVGLVAYAFMLATVLFSTTSLWGRPAVAAEIWAVRHPESMRAAQYLAQQLEKAGDYAAVRQVLRGYLDRNPGSPGIAMEVLGLSCLLEPDSSHEKELAIAEANLRIPRFEHGIFEALRLLQRLAEEERCESVTRGTVYDLTMIATANPAVKAVPGILHNLQILMAEEAFAQRNLDLTMHHIEAALAAQYTVSTLKAAVEMLRSAGLDTAAETFVADAKVHAPTHLLRWIIWREQLDELEELLDGRNNHGS